jgi:predicted nuclease with TOPRIM domain
MTSNTDLNLDDVFLDAEEMLKNIPSDEKLANLSRLAGEQHSLEQEIARMEADLDEKKKLYRELSEIKLPELMDELQISEFRMPNGVKVSIAPYYSGKITDSRAYEWLEENNHADIIKGNVNIPFPKGFDIEVLKIVESAAKKIGLSAEVKEEVHPSTLRAWIKDMVTTGQIFPRDLFNVYIGKRTKLSLK